MTDHTERRLRLGAYAVIVGVGTALCLKLFFRYLFSLCLPPLIALLMALCLRPAAEKLARRLHLGAGAVCLVLSLLFCAGLGGLLVLSARQLLREGIQMLARLAADGGATGVYTRLQNAVSALPFVGETLAGRQLLRGAVESAVTQAAAALPGLLAGAMAALPELLFSLLLFALCTVTFCLEFDRMRAMAHRLPEKWLSRLRTVRQSAFTAAGASLQVYLLLLLLTFALLFAGFTLLRVPYALTLSLLVALFDLLPVIGVGTFLLPAGILCLATGDAFRGAGLLALYLVILLLRQILQNRFLGRSFGLHPVPMLLLTFAGLRFFGLWGMLGAPLLAAIGKALWLARKGETKPAN